MGMEREDVRDEIQTTLTFLRWAQEEGRVESAIAHLVFLVTEQQAMIERLKARLDGIQETNGLWDGS